MNEGLFSAFVTLFVVVDPIGVAAVFMALTPNVTLQARRRMALHGTVLAAAILLAFFFIGDPLLRILGVGIPAFRIAGGLLLLLLAIDMVFARQSGLRSTTAEEQAEAEHKPDVSVFPLAFPLIAGPGAMTTVLLMASAGTGVPAFAAMLGVLVAVLALTAAALYFAAAIVARLGETGVNVVSRVLGLVLAALAVQYMLDGLSAAFHAT